MQTHPNVKLRPLSGEHLLRRHKDCAEPLAILAAQAGISGTVPADALIAASVAAASATVLAP
jgi:hypothetical protein